MNREAQTVTAAVLERYWESHSQGDRCDDGCPFCKSSDLQNAYAQVSKNEDILTLGARALDLKREIRKLKKELDDRKSLLDAILTKLPQLMVSRRLETFDIDGAKIYKRTDIHVSKRGEAQKDKFLEALELAGAGHCIVTQHHAGSLKSFIREMKKEAIEARDDGDWRVELKDQLGELYPMLNLYEETKAVIQGFGEE